MKIVASIMAGLFALSTWAEARNTLVSEADTVRMIKILGEVEGATDPHPYMTMVRAQNLNCVRSSKKCTFMVKGGATRTLENAAELMSIVDRAIETSVSASSPDILVPYVSCSIEQISKAMACWLVFK